ncbi:MAG: hypothetical protein ACFB10_03945 [Salibacteraceae bacterium]
MKTSIIIPLGLFLLALFVGCKRAELNRETSTTEDHALAESMVNDLYSVCLEAIAVNESGFHKEETPLFFLGDGALLNSSQEDSTDYPRVLTISFDEEGCLGSDGRRRYGAVSITIDGPYETQGTRVSITPTEYRVDLIGLSGKQWLENLGSNTAGNLEFNHLVREVRVTEDGFVISFNATYTREWIAGRSTDLLTNGITAFLDDDFRIEGFADGVSKDGQIYRTEIEEPILHRIGCRWILEGEIDLIPEQIKTRHIFYGSGRCDNEVEVEIGSNSFDTTMR